MPDSLYKRIVQQGSDALQSVLSKSILLSFIHQEWEEITESPRRKWKTFVQVVGEESLHKLNTGLKKVNGVSGKKKKGVKHVKGDL